MKKIVRKGLVILMIVCFMTALFSNVNIRQVEANETTHSKLTPASVTISSAHSYWGAAYLNDDNTSGSTFWTNNDNIKNTEAMISVTASLQEATNVSYFYLYPRIDGGNATLFPTDFYVEVSEDGTNWYTVIHYAQYNHTDTSAPLDPLKIWIDRGNVKHVRLNIHKSASVQYVQLAEVDVYSPNTWDNEKNLLREVAISKIESNSEHSHWNKSYLADGAIGGTLWTNSDSDKSIAKTISNTFTLSKAQNVKYVDIYQRTYNGVFPTDFSVSVSANGSTWEKVSTYENYTHSNPERPLRVPVGAADVGFVKVDIEKSASTQYVQLAEVKVWSEPTYEKLTFSSATATSSHVSWQPAHLINGVTTGTSFWSSGDDVKAEATTVSATVGFAEAQDVAYIELYPKTNSSGAVECFAANFSVEISRDGENWSHVISYAQYSHSNSSMPLFVWIEKEDVKQIRLNLSKNAGGYVQLAEIQAFTQDTWSADSSLLREIGISDLECSTEHSTWNSSYLIDGNIGGTLWTNADADRTQKTTITQVYTIEGNPNVQYVDIYPRANALTMPKNFTISVSQDGDTWVEVGKYVNYTQIYDWQPLRTYVNCAGVKKVKIEIEKSAFVQYVQMSEVKILSAMQQHVEQLDLGAVTTINGNETITRTVPVAKESGYESWTFAGWFEDAACSTAVPTTTTSGTYYAKFVPSEVLSVKCQVLAGTDASSADTKMRFISTVDNLKYSKVGFDVTYDGREIPYETDTVYTEIVAKDGGVAYTEKPNIFHPLSEYFNTVTLINIKNEDGNFEEDIVIKPYWVTLDGTKVYGVTRTVTVAESYQ